MLNYRNKDEFADMLNEARERIHNAYELDLRHKGRGGDIFALKNFGWTDERTQTVNANISVVGMNIIQPALDDGQDAYIEGEATPLITQPDGNGSVSVSEQTEEQAEAEGQPPPCENEVKLTEK